MRWWVLGVALMYGCSSAPDGPADLVFVGGAIFTQDPSLPWATALAVRGEHIVLVGSRADVEAVIGERTRVIDLDDRLLLPRLNDEALVAIHEAVTGRSLWGHATKARRVPVEVAIATHVSGALVTGSLADMSVLQENIVKIPPERIAEAKVEMTVVGGRVTYVAPTFDQGFSATLQ